VFLPRGGEKTGPNPTDRRKSGSKRHVVVERKGIPLAVKHTVANVCDITVLLPMVDAIPTLANSAGTLQNRPEKLHGDKGYDSNKHRLELEKRGIIPRLGRRRIDDHSHLGEHRWVVERTLAWLNPFVVCVSVTNAGMISIKPSLPLAVLDLFQVRS